MLTRYKKSCIILKIKGQNKYIICFDLFLFDKKYNYCNKIKDFDNIIFSFLSNKILRN